MALLPGKCLLLRRINKTGITQSELAERVGTSRAMIWKYAHNEKVMSLIMAKRISDVLGCSIEELYTWDFAQKADE